MLEKCLMKSFLILFLGAGSCSVGDFCDLADPLQTKDQQVGRYLIENDIELAVGMAVHNKFGQDKCDWELE